MKIISYFVITAVILITAIICYYIYQNMTYKKETFQQPKRNIPGKTIWLLWLQGWNDDTPWMIKQVKKSWEQLNTEWNIELVTQDNLSEYVDIDYINEPCIQAAAKSDIIRLHLLAEHGGVWADATLLCMIPLDNWIYEVLEDCKFWMYHGRDYGNGPASWFMISIKNSYIARKWMQACDDFWGQIIANKTCHDYEYYWMDGLFKNLCINDPKFLQEWEKVPYIWCESRGQAHMLAGKCLQNDADLKDILLHTPPYVLKLSRHGFDDNNPEHKESNAYAAIQYALEQKHAPYPLHKILKKPLEKHVWADTVAVSADCGATSEIIELYDTCKQNDIELVIYDKCNFCKNIPENIKCSPLKNVGRESNTYLYFVLRYYDNLPENILLVPSAIDKHDRKIRLNNMIMDKNNTGCGGDTLGSQADFFLSEWDTKPLIIADTRPFKAWYEKYVDIWEPETAGACWTGIMRTNKERILRHSRYYYLNIYNQVIQGDNIESGHYMERALQSVF
jgi:hypothetical protein